MSKAVLIINDESHSIDYAIFHQCGSKVDTASAAATSGHHNHWLGKLSLLTSCGTLVLPIIITTWYTLLLIAIPSAFMVDTSI